MFNKTRIYSLLSEFILNQLNSVDSDCENE